MKKLIPLLLFCMFAMFSTLTARPLPKIKMDERTEIVKVCNAETVIINEIASVGIAVTKKVDGLGYSKQVFEAPKDQPFKVTNAAKDERTVIFSFLDNKKPRQTKQVISHIDPGLIV